MNSFLLSYTEYGKKYGSITAKNNILTSPSSLKFTVQVMGDIGVSLQLHPAPTVEDVLKIATEQQFEIGVSVSSHHAVNYTFDFGDDSSSEVFTDDGDTKVTHTYHKEGKYNINITARVFGYEEKRLVHVTALRCGPPAIYFPNKYTEEDPQIITRGTKIDFLKIRVEKPTDCSQELDPTYLWKISPSHIPGYPEPDNESASFELEPRRLNSGNYSVTLNISYQAEAKYWFNTHLRVISSQLVASITGGSSLEIDSSLKTPLNLDASTSFDPDNRDDKSKLKFEWMCKFENNSERTVPDELCNSIGFIKLRPDVDNEGIVQLNVSRFREYVTYFFKVTVSEGSGSSSRSSSAEQRVKFLPNIPSLEIR